MAGKQYRANSIITNIVYEEASEQPWKFTQAELEVWALVGLYGQQGYHPGLLLAAFPEATSYDVETDAPWAQNCWDPPTKRSPTWRRRYGGRC